LSICNLCNSSVDPEAQLAWRKDGFDVLRCPECGLVFRAHPPARAELGGIYAIEYFRDSADGANRHGYSDYLRDEPQHRANARRRLRVVERHARRRGRLLDVGCAAGFFVDEARLRGWEAEGIDVSSEMATWARAHLGARVAEGTLNDVALNPGAFDAITMWDYIEHAVDPVADLAQSHELLRKGGTLALSTGDIGSAVARLSGRRWHLLTPRHHNFFFSRKTLARLLGSCGFEVVQMSAPAARYSLHHVVYKLEALLRAPRLRGLAARIAAGGVGRTAVPLNLFDIVTVVARKA
jgi:2-polyprenyl-3-methyl-5-hydroxy-6-metoxy-1,4-benzoquinol methylase